ncbi:putative Calcium-binding protein 39 [Paratrimastix pyriformis]|uniref:Calcium-binding protein 39 n=1 Tax=Paratrimastix pyriformis TaxID=342808 RepID=A0ABQ8UNK6_9EUKA|nr:putative Calcium-binding protein 39 [Paratrimastix pyriformis]
MSFSFFKKKKSPVELVRGIQEILHTLPERQRDPRNMEKTVEELSKLLAATKVVLYGDAENEANPESIAQLVSETVQSDILPLLITNLEVAEFESRKDIAMIFNAILRREVGGQSVVQYLLVHPEVIETLVRSYENVPIALTAGNMLRELLSYEVLARQLLESESFYKFFSYVEMSNFDVSSDAFATFKDLLTRHKAMVADFLARNYDRVMSSYATLLNSQNYVTRRQSIKLLGELLLDRANFSIMTHYISEPNNLKSMMMLLRDHSKNIQFEAFHVFKVFVANPQKPAPIVEILAKNKDKLIQFLTNFHNDKEDEQFNEEKQLLLREIARL